MSKVTAPDHYMVGVLDNDGAAETEFTLLYPVGHELARCQHGSAMGIIGIRNIASDVFAFCALDGPADLDQIDAIVHIPHGCSVAPRNSMSPYAALALRIAIISACGGIVEGFCLVARCSK